MLPVEFPPRSTSGAELRAVHVPAGTTVAISILAANYNKVVWGDDADVWRPERWLTSTGGRVGVAGGTGLDLDLDLDPGLGAELDDTTHRRVAEGTPGTTATGVRYPGVYASMMTFLGGGRACM